MMSRTGTRTRWMKGQTIRIGRSRRATMLAGAVGTAPVPQLVPLVICRVPLILLGGLVVAMLLETHI